MYIDESGEFINIPLISNSKWVQEAATAAYNQNTTWKYAMDNPGKTSLMVGVGGGLAAYGGGAVLTNLSTAYLQSAGTACLAFCEKTSQVIQKATSSWPGPQSGSQIINGIKYTEHALARMMPEGMSWVDKAGNIIQGRGVPPSVVQNAMNVGTKAPSYDSAVTHTFENIKVISNTAGNIIRSVIKTGN